jgi:transposase
MMTARTGEQDLLGWLKLVEADDQPERNSFAAGIRQDMNAVPTGLTLPYSSGTVHGNVNRLIMWNQACKPAVDISAP